MKINEHIKHSGRWAAPERDFSSLLLDLNENQFLKRFLAQFIANDLQAIDLFTYPNYQPLLAELARYTLVPTDNLLLTNGADQAIDLVLRMLFSAGDRVIIPSPMFSLYHQMLSVNGVVPVAIAFEKQAQRFVLPLEFILDALEHCQGLILCNPNNPLGMRIAAEQIETLVTACVRLDKPLIIDECYYEYLQWTCLQAFSTVRQLFVIRSFSKYFGLAGLRLGYVVARPAGIRELLKLRGPWDVNHAAVKAALFCLKNLAALEQVHRQLLHTKGEITRFCQACGFIVYESDTNFLLLQDDTEGSLAKGFSQSNICVSDCSHYPYSFGLLNHVLRVSVPASSDLDKFMTTVLAAREIQIKGKALKKTVL